MTKSILTVLLQIVAFFVDRSALEAKGKKKFYEFIEEVDEAGAARVANLIAVEDALKKKQQEIRDRLEKEQKNP